jgi:hypothetical protein
LLYENITKFRDVAGQKGMKEKSEEFIEGGRDLCS